jgi:hypothetical protein
MVEKGPQLSTRLRVQLVSWRTLRRRAEVVDTTATGDPVVTVGPERLVLPGGARHFRRYVCCALCGAEFLDRKPVFSVGELDRPGRSALCAACSRLGGLSP